MLYAELTSTVISRRSHKAELQTCMLVNDTQWRYSYCQVYRFYTLTLFLLKKIAFKQWRYSYCQVDCFCTSDSDVIFTEGCFYTVTLFLLPSRLFFALVTVTWFLLKIAFTQWRYSYCQVGWFYTVTLFLLPSGLPLMPSHIKTTTVSLRCSCFRLANRNDTW